jgi:hypothetical protein
MLDQNQFNHFVEDYNADYIFLLKRAATGNYNCLLTSARILKDLHDMIMKLHEVTQLSFEIIPFPFTVRGNQQYFEKMGFAGDEIDNIMNFHVFVKDQFGKEFEEYMEMSRPVLCASY